MAIEISDLPMNSMVMFHSYVNVYQKVFHQHDKSEVHKENDFRIES